HPAEFATEPKQGQVAGSTLTDALRPWVKPCVCEAQLRARLNDTRLCRVAGGKFKAPTLPGRHRDVLERAGEVLPAACTVRKATTQRLTCWVSHDSGDQLQ